MSCILHQHFPKYLRKEHCVASWVMLARGTPLQLESNAKMSVKPHLPLPQTFFSCLRGAGGGGGRHDTSISIPGSLFFSVPNSKLLKKKLKDVSTHHLRQVSQWLLLHLQRHYVGHICTRHSAEIDWPYSEYTDCYCSHLGGDHWNRTCKLTLLAQQP